MTRILLTLALLMAPLTGCPAPTTSDDDDSAGDDDDATGDDDDATGDDDDATGDDDDATGDDDDDATGDDDDDATGDDDDSAADETNALNARNPGWTDAGGDGIWSPGESLLISADLFNDGSFAHHYPTFLLEVDSPDVEISLTAEWSFFAMAPGDGLAGDWTVNAAEAADTPQEITFTITGRNLHPEEPCGSAPTPCVETTPLVFSVWLEVEGPPPSEMSCLDSCNAREELLGGCFRTRFGFDECNAWCDRNNGTWNPAEWEAFDTCARTDYLCFVDVEDCMGWTPGSDADGTWVGSEITVEVLPFPDGRPLNSVSVDEDGTVWVAGFGPEVFGLSPADTAGAWTTVETPMDDIVALEHREDGLFVLAGNGDIVTGNTEGWTTWATGRPCAGTETISTGDDQTYVVPCGYFSGHARFRPDEPGSLEESDELVRDAISWGPDNVLAATTGRIQRFTGGDWASEDAWMPVETSASGGLENTRRIWSNNGFDLIAGDGTGSISRWDGATWTDDGDVLDGLLGDIWGFDDVYFAVGNGGALHFYDGSAWNLIPTGTFENLNAIRGTPGGNIIAVGDGGTVLVIQAGGS